MLSIVVKANGSIVFDASAATKLLKDDSPATNFPETMYRMEQIAKRYAKTFTFTSVYCRGWRELNKQTGCNASERESACSGTPPEIPPDGNLV